MSTQPGDVVHCEIVVEGPAPESAAASPTALTITTHGDRTMLTGEVRDHSQLYGVLVQLAELGMRVLEVTTDPQR
ncbi:hypothetical protein ACLQ3C_07265 [Gordonia sp. DT30]|uniref:hypothetical protein n=1 Tax=unclassified Gordonia (in: high G+C Gram-positive bacteria) TaxID=2657482 RepID=UPI003CEDC466